MCKWAAVGRVLVRPVTVRCLSERACERERVLQRRLACRDGNRFFFLYRMYLLYPISLQRYADLSPYYQRGEQIGRGLGVTLYLRLGQTSKLPPDDGGEDLYFCFSPLPNGTGAVLLPFAAADPNGRANIFPPQQHTTTCTGSQHLGL